MWINEFKVTELGDTVLPITVRFQRPQKFNAAIEGEIMPFNNGVQEFVNYINTETKIQKGEIVEGETNDA